MLCDVKITPLALTIATSLIHAFLVCLILCLCMSFCANLPATWYTCLRLSESFSVLLRSHYVFAPASPSGLMSCSSYGMRDVSKPHSYLPSSLEEVILCGAFRP